MDFEERILKLDLCIKSWFNKTGNTEARPRDLMEYLIECNIYLKDDPERTGKRLRDDLRKLRSENRLYLISACHPRYAPKTTQWYFRKI